MKKRIVITGFGLLSSIGNNEKDVFHSLYSGTSGISFSKKMKDFGIRSHVCGKIKISDVNFKINKKKLRFMNKSTIYAYIAMKKAIISARIPSKLYQFNPRVGLIVGSGARNFNYLKLIKKNNKKKKKNIYFDPYIALKSMSSGVSACLSTFFKIFGTCYSISSACATSSHCIGNAVDLIRSGKQDVIFAGGAEEVSCELAAEFDGMRVLSKKYNAYPDISSRAYDMDRDGFVISGGSGIVVIEELNFALSRKAKIYGEIIDHSVTSNGFDMVRPSRSGAIRSMKQAMKNIIDPIDYINTHGTSTKIGDVIELDAIRKVFKGISMPFISSTKSISGHSLGSSGVHELIYILIMFKYNFIAPSINIRKIDPIAKNMNIVVKSIKKKFLLAMSNNFGFGGFNSTLIVKRF